MPVEPGSQISAYPERTALTGAERLVCDRVTPSAQTQQFTTAVLRSFAQRSGVKTVSATTYTLESGDNLLGLIVFTSSSAVTVTVPAVATVSFPLGEAVLLLAAGTGQVSVVGAGGVTVLTPTGITASLFGEGSTAALVPYATDEWSLTGDLELAP